MGRIIGYQYDDNVQDGDAWIGSEDGGGRTKQYTAEAVANYLNIQGKISIVGQMTYKYGVTPLSGPGTFAVFGGGTDPVAFSAITKLTLSNADVSKQRVVEFLNLLVGSDILISKQSAISTFGYYSIDSYAVNATDPAYYDLGVTFKSGNGSMEAEQIYETQNFTLAAEENISTLQTTIDAGNTYASGTSLWQWDPGKISQVDPDEGWGLVLSPEEGVIFTNGVGNSAGRSYLQATNLSIGNLTYTGSVFADNLTANRNFQLPNNSGTLALTTDITSSPWDTVTGGINYANGNVGIGTTTPSAKLDVNGDALINGLTVGQGAGTSDFGNTVFGKTALDSITTGRRNVAIGNEALLDNTVGNHNIALGYRSLENNSASNNVAIGVEALQRVETAGNNTAIGRYALGLTSGAGNTAIGYAAGYLRVGGTNGGSINSVFIGSLTTSNGINPENEIVIGTGAVSAGSNTVVLGNDDIVSTRLKGDVIVANGNVGIGTTSPQAKLHIDQTSTTLGGAYVYSNAIHTGTSTNSLVSIRQDNVFSTGTVLDIRGDGTGDKLVVWDTTDVSLMVKDGGNVGIGTAAPGAKLQISTGEAYEVGSLSGSVMIAPSSVAFNGYGSGIVLGAGRGGLPNGGAAIASVLDSASDSDRSGLSFFYHDGSFSGPRTEGMRLNADGNVGIGTTSPGHKLEVFQTGNSLSIGDNTNAQTYMSFANTRTMVGYSGANALIQGGSGKGIQFNVNDDTFNSGEAMRITSAGNVGIGTTSPSHKLTVNAANNTTAVGIDFPSAHFNFSANSTSGYTSNFRLDDVGMDIGHDSTARSLNLQTGNLDRVTILGNGNVGIGTTSPQTLLHLQSTGSPSLRIQDSDGTDQYATINHSNGANQYIARNNTSNGSHIFYGQAGASSFNERMRITSAGNVGIGTTSPGAKLEVVDGGGNGQVNENILVNMPTASNYVSGTANTIGFKGLSQYFGALGGYTNGAPGLGFWNGVNTGTPSMVLIAGNVGIGTTSPLRKLDLIADLSTDAVRIKNTNSNGGGLSVFAANGGGGTNRILTLGDSSENVKVAVIENGNVGIGVTNPGSKLHVNGTSFFFDQAIFDDKVGIGTTSPSQKLEVDGQVLSDGYRLAAMQTAPAARNSTGTLGEIVIDGNHIYVCYATDSWSRVALDTSW